MAHDATHDDLARLRRWRPRTPADTAEARPAPDPLQVGALLDEIGALRLSLSVDMDVLASAVDLRAYDVAAEVVDGDRADLAAFTDRATARLASVAGEPAPPTAVRRGVVRVLRAALPAAPALAAAAALIGVLAGLTPGPRASAPDPFGASNAGFAELFGVQEESSAVERDTAQALREEVVRVMALAMHDPQAAAEELQGLSARVEQVEDEGTRAELRDALAEVARLLAALEVRLGTAPVTTPVRDVVAELSEGPSSLPLPAPSAASSPAAGTPRSADGAQSTDASPDDAEQPNPTPTPTPSPSEESSVPDVLDGGSANGSTKVLPGTAPGVLG